MDEEAYCHVYQDAYNEAWGDTDGRLQSRKVLDVLEASVVSDLWRLAVGFIVTAYKKLANSSMQLTTAYERIMLAHVQEKAAFPQMEFGMRAGRPRRV